MKMQAILVLFLFCGCLGQINEYRQEAHDVIENKMEEGTVALEFETYNGNIEIHVWEKDSYRIEVKKWVYAFSKEKAEERIKKINVEFKEEEKALLLNIKLPKDLMNSGADIEAYIPKRIFNTIRLQTYNGHIGTETVEASHIVLKTFNGNIEANLKGSVIEIETFNGEVKGTFSGAEVSIQTFNGEIDGECRGEGRYDVKTSNGKIKILTTGDFGFDLDTSNGSLLVTAGEVTYTLNEKKHKKGYTSDPAAIFIKASTTNGSIEIIKK